MGTVYLRRKKLWIGYVDASGEWVYKSSGLGPEHEPKVRAALRKLEERIAAGAALGERDHGPVTLRRFAEKWLKGREGAETASARSARYYLAHALRHLGDKKLAEVRRSDVKEMVQALANRGRRLRGEGRLAPRTVRHIYFTLQEVFADAVDDRLLEANPCSLRRGQLPKVVDKDPTWRRDAQFTRDELEVLISNPSIQPRDRLAAALMGLGGMRPGEASALRWRCWSPELRPLGRLDVVAAYDSILGREKGTKTGTAREVPVHPALARLLAEWKLVGWRALVGRAPKPEDLIIPMMDAPGAEPRIRHKDEGLGALCTATDALEWRRRRQYDLRRTFVSLARAGGARVDILKWVTHGPPKTVIDGYTTLPWETLCEVVSCVRVELREPEVIAIAAGGKEPRPSPPPVTTRTTRLHDRPHSTVSAPKWPSAETRGKSLQSVAGSSRPALTVGFGEPLDEVRILVPQPPTPPPLLLDSGTCSTRVVRREARPLERRAYRPPAVLLDVDVFELARRA